MIPRTGNDTGVTVNRRLITRRMFAIGSAQLLALGLVACSAPAATSTPAPAQPTTAGTAQTGAQPAATSAASPAAGATTAPATSNDPTGQISVAFEPFAPAFNPGITSGANRSIFFWPAFDALTWVDGRGALQPALASSWSSSDGRQWTFKLRDDIKFHDGTPLIAQDVVGTFNYYRNTENALAVATLFSDVESITAPDSSTVVFNLKVTQPVFPKMMSMPLVLKGRDLQPNDTNAYQAYLQSPVGTGPYRFASFQQGTELIYEAMPSSFVSPRGPAPVKTLNMRSLPDGSTRASAVKSGEVQIAYPVSPDSLNDLKASGFTVTSVPAVGCVHIVLNTYEGPATDVRVRRALNHAINREQLLSAVRGGFGQPDGQLLGPAMLGYNPNIKPYDYNPERAKSLLAEAGYPNGLDMGVFSFQTSGWLGQLAAEAIAADLAKVGVQTELQGIAQPVWVDQYYGGPSSRSPLWPGSASWDQTFDAAIIYRWFSTDFAEDRGRRWTDSEFNDLYQRAKAEMNEQTRAQLFQQAAQRLHDQAPVVFLWLNDEPAVLDSKKVAWQPGLTADMFTRKLTLKS